MASTYDRVRVILGRIARRTSWDIDKLADSIRDDKLAEFRFRGDGTEPDHYMSSASIRSIIRLMGELRIVDLQSGKAKATVLGERCNGDDERFARQIQLSVKELLSNDGIDQARLKGAVARIQLPNVPDADTIFDELTADGPVGKMTAPRFRKLMYLWSSSGGIERVVRAHYSL
ncbi:hypothetical protein LTQ56_17690 [Mycobacterium intracellulare subsp. intracellulare]|uniref:hypothetical protein n=1 Tax=Mycobacterium intracellulare TaxID=1767 RepID=UPI0012F4CF17|nr:hypothetical protein [Mycobacterium intracellulare]UGU05768.1 hypothetical protein LTQ56_17690 [Mycobacterium intracellulare subsp. intracellulare]BCO59624.1 hypothetical protein MINTM005_48680 [Mycobacterium intracellulare]BCO96804.1 hypothetical protein MINTM016_47800 [Mycobacterium intracellulare]